MQFRVIVVTDPPTHTPTHPKTGPITIYCAAASAQCNQLFSQHSLSLRFNGHFLGEPWLAGVC